MENHVLSLSTIRGPLRRDTSHHRGRCSQLGWPEPHIADRIDGAGIAKLLCCPRSTGKPERGPDSARQPDGQTGQNSVLGVAFCLEESHKLSKRSQRNHPDPKVVERLTNHTPHIPCFGSGARCTALCHPSATWNLKL